MNIQWYPGHMTRTRRQMVENIRRVDAVCEVVDARIPQVSRNPDMDDIAAGKPRLLVLNRTDLADPDATQRWAAYYRRQGYAVLTTDARSGAGVAKFASAVRALLADKIAQWNAKGQTGKPVRVMVVGIPNVGKSTFINRVLGRKSAKAADKPGVTRGSQWFRVEGGLELLDTPGILWPKLDDERTGIYLAVTGAVKDDILDVETLACKLMELLFRHAPQSIAGRYGIELPAAEDEVDFLGYELLLRAGRKRGFLISGGEIDTERMARILLDEFRGGKLGRITLETPNEYAGAEEQTDGEAE
ncbi:MAG TPA: ribosome biogenesis GTPase YlqF [Candidatus Butyricicoccus stercorigallinarum]|nr:ribosome biogenesis GTPase YlqF [Candidatus Butyricicoccus stercorigallinarum]